MEKPWGVLRDKEGQVRKDDRKIVQIGEVCQYYERLLTVGGNVCLRVNTWDLGDWMNALKKARLTVEYQPQIIARAPHKVFDRKPAEATRMTRTFAYV